MREVVEVMESVKTAMRSPAVPVRANRGCRKQSYRNRGGYRCRGGAEGAIHVRAPAAHRSIG